MKNRKKLTDILYWISLLGLLIWFSYTKGWILTNFESINAKQAIQILNSDKNVTLLDVRTIKEYKEGHLRDSTLIPLHALEKNLGMLKQDKDKKIIVYCRSGNRSISASRILKKYGFTPLNVKGGITSFISEKVEIVK